MPPPDFNQVVLATFNTSIQKYVAMHRRLEGSVVTLEVSRDPAAIARAVEALAARIREERSHARQGEIFTRDVSTEFRRSVKACLGGRAVGEMLQQLDEERLEGEEAWYGPLPRPRINYPYPRGAAYMAMPPILACGLPPLPAELRYVFAGRTLLIVDRHADIVVDALPGALPKDET